MNAQDLLAKLQANPETASSSDAMGWCQHVIYLLFRKNSGPNLRERVSLEAAIDFLGKGCLDYAIEALVQALQPGEAPTGLRGADEERLLSMSKEAFDDALNEVNRP